MNWFKMLGTEWDLKENSYMCCVCMSASVLIATNLIRIHAVNGLRPDSW